MAYNIMYNEGNTNARPIANRVKEVDDKARKFVYDYVYSKFYTISDAGWAVDQYSWFDGVICSASTWSFVELKTRHVNSTAYDGLTAIELDKVKEIEKFGVDKDGNNITNIIILFRDCVAWLPPSNYQKAKRGQQILHGAPDQNASTGEWTAQDKVAQLFDIQQFVRMPYSYFNTTKPNWV